MNHENATLELKPDLIPASYSQLPQIQVAAGTIAGSDHLRVGRGSQDAWAVRCGRRAVVAVVADGCGSGARSEVGAELGVALFTEALFRRLESGERIAAQSTLSQARDDVIAQLRVLAASMPGPVTDCVSRRFLFTLVGVVITASLTVTFSIGDGIIVVDGVETIIGPYPDNQPPYLGYGVIDPTLTPAVDVHAVIPTDSFTCIAIGTDGAIDLAAAKSFPMPGRDQPVGALDQFWTEDRYFTNRDRLRRRLALMNREVVSADWDAQRLDRTRPLLPDDTTLVVLRKPPHGGS